MTKRHIVIATRESPLALKQAEIVKKLLLGLYPFLSIELLGMTTQGDREQTSNLSEVGGKGLFLKELEEALLARRADIAVHSMKDVPMTLPPGLVIPVMLKREDPRDAFVSNQFASILQLPSGARVGTSSLRRQTQLRALRSDLTFENVRGNVNTRLSKLDSGEYDALILAGAGLKRLNLTSRIRSYLSVEQVLPAAGQGALGIECLEDAHQIHELIAPLNDKTTFECVMAERAVCRKLDGGCTVPIGAYAHYHHGVLKLEGLVANENGTNILRAKREGHLHEAENIGERVALELLQQGAEKILREFHGK